MNIRRSLLHLRFVVFSALVQFAFFPQSGAAGQSAGKPNILHIHADDHRADGLRALGNPILQTPNLDTLVEHGMTFTRCYTMGSMIVGVDVKDVGFAGG